MDAIKSNEELENRLFLLLTEFDVIYTAVRNAKLSLKQVDHFALAVLGSYWGVQDELESSIMIT